MQCETRPLRSGCGLREKNSEASLAFQLEVDVTGASTMLRILVEGECHAIYRLISCHRHARGVNDKTQLAGFPART